MKTKSIVATLALGSLVTLGGCASSPFTANAMDSGYKHGEKSMEGSCADKKMESSCGDKKMEGSCAADKKMDAKCGEAKCGGSQ